MEVRLLGTLEVLDDRGSVVPLGGRKQRIVLAALAAHGVTSTDRLIDTVWGDDPPARPDATLQVYISTLRKLLRSSVGATIDRTAAGYRLVVPPQGVDVDRFTVLVRQGLDATAAEAALDRFTSALALWRGPVLADLADEPFVEEYQVALVEQWRAASIGSMESLLGLGRHDEAVPVLERLTRRHPEEERAWALLMTALYRCGRTADAVAAFGRARRAIIEATGLDPSPTLSGLHGRILHHDAGLLGAPEQPPSGTPTQPRRRELWQVIGTGVLGREVEIARTVAALRAGELVTLVGPPGVGKTAVAAATALRLDPWRTVTWFDLDEASSDDVRSAAERAAAADDRLPVLDGDQTAEVLANTLTGHVGAVLLTRRAPVGVPGEVVVPVGPLEPAYARDLFLARASRIGQRDAVTSAAATVERICDLVDRLPLGIELAAAETLRAAPADILARLEGQVDRLGDPTRPGPARHRFLGAAFRTAVDSLPAQHADDLVQLMVFRGGWTLEAQRAVLGDASAMRLSELVNLGLVWPDRSGSRFRYRMPAAVADLVRGQGPMREATVREATGRAHAAYFAGECRRWRDLRHGAQAQLIGESLQLDSANIRAAMQNAWDLDGELAAAVAVSINSTFHTPSSVAWFHEQVARLVTRGAGNGPDRHRLLVIHANLLYLRNHEAEAESILQAALSELEPTDDAAIRARDVLAQMRADRGDPSALELSQAAIDAAEATGRTSQLTSTLDGAVLAAIVLGEFTRALDWTMDALAVADAVHDDYSRSFILMRQGWIEHLAGDDRVALDRARQAEALAIEMHNETVRVEAVLVTGQALLGIDPVAALPYLTRSALAKVDMEMPDDLADALIAVAAGCAALGVDRTAAQLRAAADFRFDAVGSAPSVYVNRMQPWLAALADRLSPTELRRAGRAGRMLSDQALREVLEELGRDGAPPVDPAGQVMGFSAGAGAADQPM